MSGHRVRALFHSTAMVADYDQAVGRLSQLFGLRVLEESAAPEPEIGRRGGMAWIAGGSLEIGEPITPGAPPDRFVRRTGGGMQGIALWVENFDATARHLQAHGVPMPAWFEGGFGFTSPRATGGIQFEWSSFTVPEDPRAGAPEPPFVDTPIVDVRLQAFVTALVDDPLATAERFEHDLGLPILHREPEATIGQPVVVHSLGDCVLALHQRDSETSGALWGRRYERPDVAALGLLVDDLRAARQHLAEAGVRLLREGPGELVLDPSTTGGIGIVLVDELLPGDPRR